MRRLGLIAGFIFLTFLFACTASQKNVLKKGLKGASYVLGAVSSAYGLPYSGLVNSFFDIAAGSLNTSSNFEEGAKLVSQGIANVQDQNISVDFFKDEFTSDKDSTLIEEQSEEEEFITDFDHDTFDKPTGEDEFITDFEDTSFEGFGEDSSQQFEVGIDILKEVRIGESYEARPILDGDTLTQNDNYKITFQCNMTCYLYIVQLDSTGKMDPIFPSQYVSWGNPASLDTLYTIPPDNDWFFLDENTGRETIYFIASKTRRPDIEDLFQKLEEKNKTLVQQVPVSLDESVLITRGIGGVRKGKQQTVQFQDGGQGEYSSTLFSSIEADLVMTRWFHHQ